MSKEPVSVTIDGKELKIPVPFKFKKLKRCWPHVAAATTSEEGMEAVEAAIAIIAIGLCDIKAKPEDIEAKIEELEEALGSDEIGGLQKAVMDIMVESGLLKRSEDGGIQGEANGEAATPSTETSTNTSAS